VPAGSVRGAFLSGIVWSVMGAMVSRGLTMVGTISIARILGKEGFGEYGLILTTVAMFAQFASFGVGLIATKHLAELRKTEPDRAGRILAFVYVIGLSSLGVVMVSSWLLSHDIAVRLLRAAYLEPSLKIGSVLLLFMTANSMLQGAQAGFEDFRGIARNNILQSVCFAVSVLLLTWSHGLNGAIVATTISYGIGTFACLWAVVRKCRQESIHVHFHGLWSQRRIFWQYCLPSFITGIISGPSAMLSQAMVARIPNGMAGLGGFQAAVRWRDIVMFFPGAIVRVALPILSRLKAEGDRKRFLKGILANLTINGGVALLVGLPVIALSPWILGLYGPGFRQDWDMLVILVVAGMFQAIADTFSQLNMSLGRMWYHMLVTLAYGSFLLGGSALLIPLWGVRGFVWAIAISNVVQAIMYALRCIPLFFAKAEADGAASPERSAETWPPQGRNS
jgi:O-antigen/teichoic acid export membrane protein